MKSRSLFIPVQAPQALLWQSLVVPVFLLILAGCSGGGSDAGVPVNGGNSGSMDDTDSDAEGSDEPLSQLQGTWRTDCLFEGGMLPYQRLLFSVTDNVFTFDIGYFVDASCNDAAQETVSFGSVSEAAPLVDNAERRLDLMFNQVTVTPLLSQVADSFNAISFCGVASWVPEVSIDVSGCTDSQGLLAPRTETSAVLIDDGETPDNSTDDVLFLGDLSGGEASVLNREAGFRRLR